MQLHIAAHSGFTEYRTLYFYNYILILKPKPRVDYLIHDISLILLHSFRKLCNFKESDGLDIDSSILMRAKCVEVPFLTSISWNALLAMIKTG